MRREKSRMRGVYHWNRLPRSVIESNFNVIPALSRGLNCKLLSQEPSKWNHSLIRHMPFVNLGSCIYVKVLPEKHMQFHKLLSSFCTMTGNICVCGAVPKLLYRCLLNLTKKELLKEMCLPPWKTNWTDLHFCFELDIQTYLKLTIIFALLLTSDQKRSWIILPKPSLKIFPWKGICQQLQMRHPAASRGATKWQKWVSILEQREKAAFAFFLIIIIFGMFYCLSGVYLPFSWNLPTHGNTLRFGKSLSSHILIFDLKA